MAGETDSFAPEDLSEAAVETVQPATVATSMTFEASRERTWNSLLFYEEVEDRPPLHLRLLSLRASGTLRRRRPSLTLWHFALDRAGPLHGHEDVPVIVDRELQGFRPCL